MDLMIEMKQAKRALALLGGTVLVSAFAVACAAPGTTPAATTPATGTGTAATTPAAGTTPAAKTAQVGTDNPIRITSGFQGEARQLASGGATFPQPLYEAMVQDYNRLTGVQITYGGGGSGAGRRGVLDGTFVIGGTDGLFTDDNVAAVRAAGGGEIIYIPTTLGAVGVGYNLPGINNLRLSSETVVGIFDGSITNWNDPKIAADNPGVNLPNLTITAVNRSDSSGTTEVFTRWLSDVSPAWAQNVRFGGTVNWPQAASRVAGNGNQGVANEVRNIPGAAGYIEPAFAKAGNITLASIKNPAGNFVLPTEETVSEAFATASADKLPANLAGFPLNSPGPNSYPIAATTWFAFTENQTNQAQAITAQRFLWWLLGDGQRVTVDGYYPLPTDKANAAIERLKLMKVNGQPVTALWQNR